MEKPDSSESETLKLRIHGNDDRPALVYLPGIHGDWTLISSFRHAVRDRVRFVEFTYPRTLTWTVRDYAEAINDLLLEHRIERGWVIGESFGSQVGWALLDRAAQGSGFHPEGYVLAGGFGKYPFVPGVLLMQLIFSRTPDSLA